jgi:hypothetical protein
MIIEYDGHPHQGLFVGTAGQGRFRSMFFMSPLRGHPFGSGGVHHNSYDEPADF